ncbi:MAG: DUF4349 domain-containing protein [Geodermatophilaceae bacterium]
MPAPTGLLRPTFPPRRTRMLAALVGLPLALALVTGCSDERVAAGGGGSNMTGPDIGQPLDREGSAEDEAVGGPVQKDVPADGEVGENLPPGAVALNEQVVRTGDISVDVNDLTAAANRLTAVVTAAGGSVGSDQRYGSLPGDGTDGSADLVVRLPPEVFEETLETIGALGEELSRSVAAQDVSTVVADVDARVMSLQNSVNRLLALAGQAVSVTDLIAVEAELSARQSELESLQAQQRAIADQVSLATLSVHLTATSEPETEDTGFLASVAQGWNALLAAGQGLISVLGLLLPWLLFLAVIAATLWFVVRRRRARTVTTAATAGSATAGTAAPVPAFETVSPREVSEPSPRPE